jgi:RNA dependent RNA polymerase
LTLPPLLTTAKLEKSINNWLEKSFNFRLQTNQLARVTKLHEKLIYRHNRIDTPAVESLVDIHDLLVDSEKQGYTMGDTKYVKITNQILEAEGTDPQKVQNLTPAYAENPESWLPTDNPHRSPQKSRLKPNLGNARDYLCFEVVKPHVQETWRQIKEMLPKDLLFEDNAILRPFDYQTNESERRDAIELREELVLLQQSIREIVEDFGSSSRSFPDAMQEAYDKFKALQPRNINNLVIQTWQRDEEGIPTWWERLKASCLATNHKRTSLKVLFGLAGDTFCFLKACSAPSRRMIPLDILKQMKFRKINMFDKDESISKLPAEEPYEEQGTEWSGERESLSEEYFSTFGYAEVEGD